MEKSVTVVGGMFIKTMWIKYMANHIKKHKVCIKSVYLEDRRQYWCFEIYSVMWGIAFGIVQCKTFWDLTENSVIAKQCYVGRCNARTCCSYSNTITTSGGSHWELCGSLSYIFLPAHFLGALWKLPSPMCRSFLLGT